MQGDSLMQFNYLLRRSASLPRSEVLRLSVHVHRPLQGHTNLVEGSLPEGEHLCLESRVSVRTEYHTIWLLCLEPIRSGGLLISDLRHLNSNRPGISAGSDHPVVENPSCTLSEIVRPPKMQTHSLEPPGPSS